MSDVEEKIKEIVNKETKAWDTQDVELLLSIFHPDMVWPWPKTSQDHDPINWVLELGRFDYERWKRGWEELFKTHELARNKRELKKIEISKERDAAFAVVDIDTLWVDSEGNENRWIGRVCKVYTLMSNKEWKLIMHTGVLEY
ncbi:MAG: hypothetical protein GF353_21555 [Candidatus Lokiarchaeota archaeon]|nr:hypothetical protein [Candidatus Lokiarchaeota archaeon]